MTSRLQGKITDKRGRLSLPGSQGAGEFLEGAEGVSGGEARNQVLFLHVSEP